MTQKIMRFLRFFRSLTLAIFLLLSITLALAIATFIESKMDTACAGYYVYESRWFYSLLYILSLNILLVALHRRPWKKHHIPFLLAHLGILLILLGAWITKRFGIDAHLRILEHASSQRLILKDHLLWVQKNQTFMSIPVPFLPAVETFHPIFFKQAGLWIKNYITHAQSFLQFHPLEKGYPALHLKVFGGPMQLNQDFWLWQGAPDWQAYHAGPASFELGQHTPFNAAAVQQKRVQLSLHFNNQGDLSVDAYSSEGSHIHSLLLAKDLIGSTLKTNWKAGVSVMVLNAYPAAEPTVHFQPAAKQFDPDAENPAIEIVLDTDIQKKGVWLGLGNRIQVPFQEGTYQEIGFVANEWLLPFSLTLERFEIEFNPGTKTPAFYRSHVKATSLARNESIQTIIEMNTPLYFNGYTIYQSSYEGDIQTMGTKDQPLFASIFSVNKDPGRWVKYLGSFLLVFGTFLLFKRLRKTSTSLQKKDSLGLMPQPILE